VARLKLHLVERTDFLKFLDPTAEGTGLFVPGTIAQQPGDKVSVEVVFQGGPRLLLAGIVAWRRVSGDARTRAGSGVIIEPGEQTKLNYLFGYVRGGLLDAREKRRLPVRLRVTYSGVKGRRINFTRDLNEEGAFVRAHELLEVGMGTVLLISPPGPFKPMQVKATVQRQQDTAGDRGFGVRFDFDTSQERDKMIAFIDKLESDYLEGRLPDEALL
jgi:Tfp pilus assembly protein PilZ